MTARQRAFAQAAEPRAVAVYVDPPTHQQLRDRLFERDANIQVGDDIQAPFAGIRERLTGKGIPVRTADLLPAVPDGRRNVVISFGVPDRTVRQSVRKYEAWSRRPDVILSAFFALECPIVEPSLYEWLPVLRQRFRRILSWSDSRALLPFTRTPVKVEHFAWPQSFDAVHEHLGSIRERGFLTMINTNKLPRLYADELYTARLHAVEHFHRHGEIDLYGRNWEGSPLRVGKTRTPATLRRIGERLWQVRQRQRPDPLYVAAAGASRGPVRSKSQTLARYRFALCFENCILKGYLTEKLFDCLFAGTIPVYWGAPDVLDWVPAECFVDMRRFRDFAALRAFLHAITPAQEQGYRTAARDYLASGRFDPFRLGTFVDRVARIVSADTGVDA
jgi:hypothetical protein